MKMFDPHIHMTSRTTTDYAAMAEGGITAVVEPAFWLGQPRTTAGAFIDYFNSLLGWERFRASQFGIRHFCTLSINPKESNNPRFAEEVVELLPRFLQKDGVVAVGDVGFDLQNVYSGDRVAHPYQVFAAIGNILFQQINLVQQVAVKFLRFHFDGVIYDQEDQYHRPKTTGHDVHKTQAEDGKMTFLSGHGTTLLQTTGRMYWHLCRCQ